MSELKLTGRLVTKMNKQQVTDTFTKREFVIETDEQYPQVIKFELTQAKCDDIESYSIGDTMIVHFNVRGRKWTNKKGEDNYFVSLNAWRLEGDPQEANSQPKEENKGSEPEFTDSLPF